MTGKKTYSGLIAGLRDQLVEDSDNSIENIVQSLAWNDSIYRTFNEGLRISTTDKRKRRIPKSLVDYIHIAHRSHVVIALRKLYEEKKKGRRAVNSIRTIIREIDAYSYLFTRENYLTHDGTPYEKGKSVDWRTELVIESRHGQFDLLSGVNATKRRKPGDKLDSSIPRSLLKKAILRSDIEQFVNKFLAHASARGNRPDEKLTFEGLRLSRIQAQYKNLIWAVHNIAKIVDETMLTQVPVPQFDVLMDWEQGVFDDYIKSKLQDYWDRRMLWWSKWTDHYRDSSVVYLTPRKRMVMNA